jgi:sRNA-binding carbon storage regulator CsrA
MPLLLNRRINESVTAWIDDHEPLLIRVCEVSPTGSVQLGFEGKEHTVCRTEIYHTFKHNDEHYGDTDYGNDILTHKAK